MPAKKKDKTLKNPFLLFLLVIVLLHISFSISDTANK